jgi:exosortase family protein XrtF
MTVGQLKNPFFKFIFLSTGIYLGWYFLYEFYLKPDTQFDDYIIHSLVKMAEWILSALGYALIPYQDLPLRSHIGIDGSLGVTIGEPCDGAVLFALFAAFVISFPGPFKHKLWFVPIGLLAVHLINALRVAGLALIVHINENWLSFNHDYTFTIIVYAFVFWLWWIWIKRFSPLSKAKSSNPK